jgi:hypothetical protein
MHDSEIRTACTAQSRQPSDGSFSHSALTDSNTPFAQHSPRHCLIATDLLRLRELKFESSAELHLGTTWEPACAAAERR